MEVCTSKKVQTQSSVASYQLMDVFVSGIKCNVKNADQRNFSDALFGTWLFF